MKRYILLFLLLLTSTGYSAVNTATHYKWLHITDSLRAPLVFGVTQVGDSADLVISSVGKLYAKTETADSLLATWRGVRKVAGDTLWGNSPAYATRVNVHDSVYAPGFATKANVRDSLYAHSYARYVQLRTVHGQDHPLEDNMITSLESFKNGNTAAADTFPPYLYRDSALAAGTDTVIVSGTLPFGMTDADSLIIIYQTTDGTAATQCIDSLALFVTSNGGARSAGVQWTGGANPFTNIASASFVRVAYYINDADFNGEEIAWIKIFFTSTAASKWLKVYQVVIRGR